ncbi:MAG TPA: DUF2946 family protein [Burkholderiales bacterium]|nr:DUF2946 family protein [Burkholderiales bacterium]
MDAAVVRAMARWPRVPAVYGWLSLDRRGNWLLREPAGGFGRIGNAFLRDFIARNYAADERGCWYFQNGPQRVFVALAYAPFVLHYRGATLVDHCGEAVSVRETCLDEEGSVLMRVARGVGLLDDRDLEAFASRHADWDALPRVRRPDVAARFGFVPQPADSLR